MLSWSIGYFAYNHYHMPAMQDLFGQMWKEYSLSDSRYLTSDPFVLCMESITAVRHFISLGTYRSCSFALTVPLLQILWGPLSFLVAVLITIDHPLRHPFQALVSLGQLYGDVLYYATSMFDHYYRGLTYCRPEAYYFWVYYVTLNLFWIFIPSCESDNLLARDLMGVANAWGHRFTIPEYECYGSSFQDCECHEAQVGCEWESQKECLRDWKGLQVRLFSYPSPGFSFTYPIQSTVNISFPT